METSKTHEITVRVDGGEKLTLSQFIDDNTDGEWSAVADGEIEAIKRLPVGDHIFIGVSKVERAS